MHDALSDPLFAAAYVSTPTEAFPDRALSDLLLAARRYNAMHGITGKLVAAEVHSDAGNEVVRFLQWIEGPPDAVRQCLRRIHADPRHNEMEIQFFGPIPARRYPTWDMAIESVPDALWKQATAVEVPAPHTVPVEQALGTSPHLANGG